MDFGGGGGGGDGIGCGGAVLRGVGGVGLSAVVREGGEWAVQIRW